MFHLMVCIMVLLYLLNAYEIIIKGDCYFKGSCDFGAATNSSVLYTSLEYMQFHIQRERESFNIPL